MNDKDAQAWATPAENDRPGSEHENAHYCATVA
jgi:hypothetical protein